jgi:Fur family ferric uptake transcriptional regulator
MQSVEILKTFGLYDTTSRSEILDILIKSKLALSMTEIRDMLGQACDRVTLYRNLKLFTEKGILHQIQIDGQLVKYVLPENIVKPEMIYNEHLHFKCMQCEEVKCLTDRTLENISLPEGYKMLGTNFVVFGICNVCNQN